MGGGTTKLIAIKFKDNRGLGEALKAAVDRCSYDLVARMDSDDIAVENRFDIQLNNFINNNIDICGGQIEEFIDDVNCIIGKRVVPLCDTEIKSYMKKRCPFNHMTVMYRKSSVIAAGSYLDWFWNEDYYLWIRMALNNCRFANVPDTLVKVRVGSDMYSRRGGERYFKSEIAIQRLLLEKGIISRSLYLSNCAKRFVVQKVLPNRFRAWVFRNIARKKVK